jgi:hypothetical protein
MNSARAFRRECRGGAAVATPYGFQFLIARYLRQVLGCPADRTGYAVVPIAVVSLGISVRVINRFGECRVLLAVRTSPVPVNGVYVRHARAGDAGLVSGLSNTTAPIASPRAARPRRPRPPGTTWSSGSARLLSPRRC